MAGLVGLIMAGRAGMVRTHMNHPFTRIGSVVFSLVSLGHLVRLICRWQVVVGDWPVPFWVSLAGAVLTGLLAVMLWREAGKEP